MKKIGALLLVLTLMSFADFTKGDKERIVVITTIHGSMKLKLYNETPLHRDNFIKLAEAKFYDGVLFHRVMKDFMIQGGDPQSIGAAPGQRLGNGGPGYTIPAEFNSKFIHKKGSLSAARKPDQVNPMKESSGSQFYIVQGKLTSPEDCLKIQDRRNAQLPKEQQSMYTDEQLEVYSSIGGTPHLDMAYTVFGEIISGMEVIDKIAEVPVDKYNRPLTDIQMHVMVSK